MTSFKVIILLLLVSIFLLSSVMFSNQKENIKDTLYEDDPYINRVYNYAGKYNPANIEFVELDTTYHEKQLWLSEKKAITPPPHARYSKVVGKDSIVYVAYTRAEGEWYLHTTYSINYGETWLEPNFIQGTGPNTSGHPSLSIDVNDVYIVYSISFPEEDFLREILFRKANVETLILSDSIIVSMTSSSSDNVFRPHILSWADTLYTTYNYFDNNVRYISVRKSYDFGETWIPTGGLIGNSPNFPKSFLLTDTILSVVYDRGFVVNIARSHDRGQTWPDTQYVSAAIGYPSQLPAASSDGVSDIHVVWYDFEGAPPGWAGWVFYRHSLDKGEIWSDIKSLSTYPNAEDVEIWADTNYVYAVWNDSRLEPSYKAGYLRISYDRGVTWSPEYKIIDDTEHPWEMDVYADGDNFYMVWKEQDQPGYFHQTYYMYGIWYRPGDLDNTDEIDIADLIYMVDWMFFYGEEPYIMDAAQMDGIDIINIADLVYLVEYMFFEGPPPVGGTPEI